MNSKPHDIPVSSPEQRTQIVQLLEQSGLDNLPESELPAVTEAWQAIGDHVAKLRKHPVRGGL